MRRWLAFAILTLMGAVPCLCAQAGGVTSPKAFLGHDIGEDYFLANYTQLTSYWQKLSEESPRMVLEEIGRTGYGQKMWMAVISSPQNIADRESYRKIGERLARARGLSDAQARQLARDGRSIIWIDAGMHATESVAAQNIIELAYRMCSRDDPEVRNILDKVILLVCPANPDGMELVANAYMATRRVGGLPVLYQRYVGHDNNRDFYACNTVESKAIARILYRRWYPQVVYNHHQSAPRGTIIFTPPFRDPFNYEFDPLVVRGIDLVSAHMSHRFAQESKPGSISRSGAPYSTWWNGGLRTTAYFHNMIGILTESFGSPNPSRVRQTLDQRLPYGDYPYPISSQEWHARQTIEYLQTANFAILDLAARYKKEFLFNIYQAGRNSIARGSVDHWTPTPKLLARARKGQTGGRRESDQTTGDGSRDPFVDPALRDAQVYVLPVQGNDNAATTWFVNRLIHTGVEVHRATASFSTVDRSYAEGTFVVFAAQAFRPHLRDMFEPQWHPDDIGSSGEPVRPYDSAGWTLAMQMDIAFDRFYEPLVGPFERIDGLAKRPAGPFRDGRAGWQLSRRDGDAYKAINRLLKAREHVYLGQGRGDSSETVFVAKRAGTAARMEGLATELGIEPGPLARAPAKKKRLRPIRIGLFDTFGGNMATGWTQWVLEQYEFPVELVFGSTINAGRLREKFDLLIFQTGLPSGGGVARARRGFSRRTSGKDEDLGKLVKALPPFEDWSDIAARRVAIDRKEGVAALREFVEAGGTLLTIGSQAQAAIDRFDLPVETSITIEKDGKEQRVTNAEFFIPGSLIEISVNRSVGAGASKKLAAMFRRSPSFRVADDAKGVEVHASYSGEDLLMSGWAIGVEHLEGRAAVVSASLGKGRIWLFGPDILYRGQPTGSFKLVFNSILAAAAD
ncbi:MAG: M14 family metallopeptidase [Planctomycetota bacterium]|jgi:hypothetical protein|nr:M14 family metallopeptidase [Planctomycetota bacterium]